jgi:hypothetical protein
MRQQCFGIGGVVTVSCELCDEFTLRAYVLLACRNMPFCLSEMLLQHLWSSMHHIEPQLCPDSGSHRPKRILARLRGLLEIASKRLQRLALLLDLVGSAKPEPSQGPHRRTPALHGVLKQKVGHKRGQHKPSAIAQRAQRDPEKPDVAALASIARSMSHSSSSSRRRRVADLQKLAGADESLTSALRKIAVAASAEKLIRASDPESDDDDRFFAALQELVAYAFEESIRIKKTGRLFPGWHEIHET